MIDYTLLRKLCAADGISGDEGEVRDLIINEIKDCADEIIFLYIKRAEIALRTS